MRIALWHNLPPGGGKRAFYDQVAGLVKLGHHVESWCPPTADQKFLPLSDLVTEHIVDADHVPLSKRKNLRELLNDQDLQVEAMNRHCQACAHEIDGGAFDILFAGPCREFRVTAIARYVEMPSVLYLQEPHRQFYEASPVPPWAADQRPPGWWHTPREVRSATRRAVQVRKNEVRVREEVRNAIAFEKLACNSFYSRESILRAYGLDAEVCYLGVDETHFMPNDSDRRLPFFLSVGRAAEDKNPAFVIRALGLREDRSWPLVWVANMADSRYVSELRQLANDVGVTLDLRRDIGDRELVQLYRTAGLFLYAPRLEPFGLAPLEAAACGLVTVAVAEAGTRETIAEAQNGFLVAADEALFAQKIDSVLADQDGLKKTGSLARESVVRHWGMEQAIERLDGLLRRVSGGDQYSGTSEGR